MEQMLRRQRENWSDTINVVVSDDLWGTVFWNIQIDSEVNWCKFGTIDEIHSRYKGIRE